MLIVGLVGGTALGRAAVADQIEVSRRVRFDRFDLVPAEYGPDRAQLLSDVVLKDARPDGRGQCSFNHGLILTHVETAEEAALIRQHGGMLWHVEGQPSDCIQINRDDLLVSHRCGGHRHYLDPLDAVSEALLLYHATPEY